MSATESNIQAVEQGQSTLRNSSVADSVAVVDVSGTPSELPLRTNPRKRIRPLTDRRREQNRRAQKIHLSNQVPGEKQKQQKVLVTAGIEQSAENHLNSTDQTDSYVEDDIEPFILSDPIYGLELPVTHSESPQQALHDWNSSFVPSNGTQYDHLDSAQTPLALNGTFDLPSQTLGLTQQNLDWPSYEPSGIADAIPYSLHPSGVFGSTVLNGWSIPEAVTRQVDSQTMIPHIDHCQQPTTRTLLSKHFTYEDIILAGIDAITHQIPVTLPDTTSPTERPQEIRRRHSPSSNIPSLLKTHIPFRQIALVKACLANAIHIGANVTSPTICDGRVPNNSPFFSVTHTYQPNHNSLTPTPTTTTINASYQALKADLQPCIAQVTQPHPLYIDVLPLPYFRKRILALRGCSVDGEQVLDEADLTRDIDKGGIVCWGTDSGVGSGTPWDSRSWECAEWFLKKWWMVTGGVKGEIGRQSRWWAESRGEVFNES